MRSAPRIELANHEGHVSLYATPWSKRKDHVAPVNTSKDGRGQNPRGGMSLQVVCHRLSLQPMVLMCPLLVIWPIVELGALEVHTERPKPHKAAQGVEGEMLWCASPRLHDYNRRTSDAVHVPSGSFAQNCCSSLS